MTVVKASTGKGPFLGGGFQRANDFDKGPPLVLWASRDHSSIDVEYANDDVGEDWVGDGVDLELSVEHIYSIERHPTHVVYLYDMVPNQMHAWGTTVDANSLQVRVSAYKGAFVKARYVRVRSVTSPSPSVTLGAREHLH